MNPVTSISPVKSRLKSFGTGLGIITFLLSLMVAMWYFSWRYLSKFSLRLDESQSIWQTSHSLPELLRIVAQDVHVPLYHVMLYFWRIGVGNDLEAIRSLSLVFGILIIPAIYLLGNLAFNRRTGLIAAIIMTLSPFLNWYSNEARMYSMLTLFTVLNQYFFLSIFKKRSSLFWIGYIISGILGVYTHHFFWLMLLSQAVFYIVSYKQFAKYSLPKFIASGLIFMLSITPWIFFVRSLGSASNTKPLLIKPTSIDIFNTFSQFVFGFHSDNLNTMIISLWPMLVLLGFLLLRKKRVVSQEGLFFLLSAFVPIIAAFIISFLFRPLFLSRYLIVAMPSLNLFILWILSLYNKSVSRVMQTLFVLAIGVGLISQTVSATTPVKENYLEAAQYLSQHASAQDVIILSAPFTVYPMEYYYNGSARIETLPHWNRFVPGPVPPFVEEKLPEEVKIIKGDHQRAWLLLSYDQGFEEKIRIYFDTNFERVDHKELSPKLNLYEYKLRYD